jgi:hypothetical protein
MKFIRLVFVLLALLSLGACARRSYNTPPPPVAPMPTPLSETPPRNTPTWTGGLLLQPVPTASPRSLAEITVVGVAPTAVSVSSSSQTVTPAPIIPTATPTGRELVLSEQLSLTGPRLAHNNIGFHVSPSGNLRGLGDWMTRLDNAGIPFFLKSASYAGPIFEAQNIAKSSGVPHVLVYRLQGGEFELPNYDLPPEQAARAHWARHVANFPAELDPRMVWMETINEPDKGRADWLGWFALETAKLAVRDGRRWAAFGWSAGEPEIADWGTPGMMAFLAYAGQHPDLVAVALHEYSYETETIWREYPHLVGRFQQLFWVCDFAGIPRPTVLITEWGWEYQDVPYTPEAIEHINQVSRLYALYPEVKGAAIWHLGGGFGGIAEQANLLVLPLAEYTLAHPHFVPSDRVRINPRLFEQNR